MSLGCSCRCPVRVRVKVRVRVADALRQVVGVVGVVEVMEGCCLRCAVWRRGGGKVQRCGGGVVAGVVCGAPARSPCLRSARPRGYTARQCRAGSSPPALGLGLGLGLGSGLGLGLACRAGSSPPALGLGLGLGLGLAGHLRELVLHLEEDDALASTGFAAGLRGVLPPVVTVQA